MKSTNSGQAALENLVIAHLAAIRKREAELNERLQANGAVEAQRAAADVWQLQSSADRLSRMMDAMNFSGNSAAFAV
jgi:hypothetical protein